MMEYITSADLDGITKVVSVTIILHLVHAYNGGA